MNVGVIATKTKESVLISWTAEMGGGAEGGHFPAMGATYISSSSKYTRTLDVGGCSVSGFVPACSEVSYPLSWLSFLVENIVSKI